MMLNELHPADWRGTRVRITHATHYDKPGKDRFSYLGTVKYPGNGVVFVEVETDNPLATKVRTYLARKLEVVCLPS